MKNITKILMPSLGIILLISLLSLFIYAYHNLAEQVEECESLTESYKGKIVTIVINEEAAMVLDYSCNRRRLLLRKEDGTSDWFEGFEVDLNE